MVTKAHFWGVYKGFPDTIRLVGLWPNHWFHSAMGPIFEQTMGLGWNWGRWSLIGGSWSRGRGRRGALYLTRASSGYISTWLPVTFFCFLWLQFFRLLLSASCDGCYVFPMTSPLFFPLGFLSVSCDIFFLFPVTSPLRFLPAMIWAALLSPPSHDGLRPVKPWADQILPYKSFLQHLVTIMTTNFKTRILTSESLVCSLHNLTQNILSFTHYFCLY
jgi:hypothetical protein